MAEFERLDKELKALYISQDKEYAQIWLPEQQTLVRDEEAALSGKQIETRTIADFEQTMKAKKIKGG